MSSPEVEQFEVTEEDLYNEFNPNRPQHRMSKKQHLYGIWATPDSDDDDRPGFQGRRNKPDMSAPVSFISGGYKEGSKPKRDEDGNVADTDSDREFDEVPVRHVKPKSHFRQKGQKSGRFAAGLEKQFGNWEKHTRGIGQKLLQKMGFEPGKGLGKTSQGITAPVEAVKRKPGRAALMFHGSERTAQSQRDYPTVDSEEEESKEFQEQLQQWKRQPEGQKKPKYVYKTAKEAITTGSMKKMAMPSHLSKVKVIDMTGREQRVLSGYHAISHRHDMPDLEDDELLINQTRDKATFDMPELLHNLDMLVDMAEEEIVQNDRKLHHERDMVVNMKYEKERLDQMCDQEMKQIDRLAKVLDVVAKCEQRTKPDCDDPLTLEECAEIFKNLQEEFYEEYKMYDLPALAMAIVFPLMKKFFSGWDPLRLPEYGVTIVREWKYILEDPQRQYVQDRTNMDVYQQLLWDVWLPPVRSTILKWSVRSCDTLIELLENWMPILPSWIFENIVDQLVLPRLLQEVEAWNPLTDTMPIHSWLHPWLPLMGDKLEPLYAPIRHKLSNALTNWHPSDSSAKVILQPWIGVFKPGHTNAFVIKNILPKLAMAVQEMAINPLQQELGPFEWMLAWREVIPTQSLVTMLEKTFFPRWLQVLCAWLGNMPNYEEITKWYLGWKGQFPEEIIAHPQVKEHFNRALDVMNRAMSGHFQPGAKENIAYFAHTERRQMDVQPPGPTPPAATERKYETAGSWSASMSSTGTGRFKDLVEKRAQENNLIYMPIVGKTHEAKQIYRFGKVMMYLDRNVIFMMQNQQWAPASLQTLLEAAK